MRPGEGERRALSGIVPQYRVAAEKIYGALRDGRLESIAIANPDAGTLDDVGVAKWHGSKLVLDAYQVKWSAKSSAIAQAEFRTLLVELCRSRRELITDLPRQRPNQPPIDRVIAYLHSNRPASTSAIKGQGANGSSLAAFIDNVWGPACRSDLGAQGPPQEWRPFLEGLAEACGCNADELVALAPELRIELGRSLPEDTQGPRDCEDVASLQDLDEIYTALLKLVAGREQLVWLTAAELLERLGPQWRDRVHRRRIHEFRAPENYKPLTKTQERLAAALEELDSGYLALTGSPGSGKSTLLTALLRPDRRLAARYYAYVPDDDHVDRGEARSFLHDITLTLSQGKASTGPRLIPRSEDLDLLRQRFIDELSRLRAAAVRDNTTAILLIDGLDHVERAPRPREPLLDELPAPSAVPDGVLIVLGTRSTEDLPDHIRPVAVGVRHVETEPLARQSVLSMASEAGLGEFGERVWRLSGGHPLLTRTFLHLLGAAEPSDRASVLQAIPSQPGEVWDYYESVWGGLRDSPEMVVLLGLVSRIRGAIRLRWLAETGTAEPDIERLSRLRYLFNEVAPGCWTFFHSSFQEFLRNRTAKVGGKFDLDRHRALHLDLAERAAASPADSSEAWQRLHQFLEAGRPDQVIAHASPEFFRDQLDALRPGREVIADIRQAAAALADQPDASGAVRLSLAAHEVEFRGYQFPYGDDLLALIAKTDRAELAIAQVREIDDMTSGNDRRASAMRLAIALHDAGQPARAREAFDAFEPLEWFGGRASSERQPHTGPQRALHRWARAAVVLRGAEYVIDAVGDLDPPAHRRGDRYDDEDLDDLRREVLLSAAHELIRRDLSREDVLVLEAAIERLGATPDIRATLARLKLARWKPTGEAKTQLVELLDSLPRDEIYRDNLVLIAGELLRAGAPEKARAALEGVTFDELPERYSVRPDAPSWSTWHQYYVLNACVGSPAEPAVADSDMEWQQLSVIAARHLIAFANLEGRRRTGHAIGWPEVSAALRRFDAWWDAPVDRDALHRPGEVRTLIYERALVLARWESQDAIESLYAYWVERWEAEPSRLHIEAPQRLVEMHRAGIADRKIAGLMHRYGELLGETAAPAEDWIGYGLGWLDLGNHEEADKALAAAARRTMTLGASDKDLQLGTWTTLMAPYLHGPDGSRLAADLTHAMIELEKLGIAGAADHAAEILLRVLAPAAPRDAVDLGRSLAEGRVLSPARVIDVLLEALAATPTQSWWVVTGALVTLGSDPPRNGVRRACAAHSELARAWLASISDRVSVEGRPSTRVDWRNQLREAATQVGLSLQDLRLKDEDFEIGPETPARDYEQSGVPRERSTDELFKALADDERLDSRDPAKELIRRIHKLTSEQRKVLTERVAGGDYEPHLHAALARIGLSSDPPLAWKSAMTALEEGDARAWQRHYNGGPVIDAVKTLRELAKRGEFDDAEVDAAVYRRFADLAVGDTYFLQTIGRDLDDYCEVLGFEPDATAREALATTRALLRDVAELPAPDELDVEPLRSEPVGTDIDDALTGVVLWLLRSPFNVAWGAGQRAALELVAVGLDGVLDSTLADPQIPPVRALVLLDAAVRNYDHAVSRMVPDVLTLAVDGPLDVRAAAVECLRLLGVEPPARRQQRLMAAFQIQLPPERHTIDTTDELTNMVGEFQGEIAQVAKLADLPQPALFERVLTTARRLGASHDTDEKVGRRGRVFGWRYLRPSARVTRHALAIVCAEIIDAGRASPYEILFAADLWPAYDAMLLARRPVRRPAEVATFVPLKERSTVHRKEVSELAAHAPSRLARQIDDWIVLGETSEIALLDHYDRREHRRSGVVVGVKEDGRERRVHWSPHSVSVSEYGRLADHDFDGRAIVRSGGPALESPSEWLGVHPRLALEVGLQPHPRSPLDWTLDGEAAVRSIWWRSGFAWWPTHSDIDEVGEGWLVVGTREVARRIEGLGEARRAWHTRTTERPDGSTLGEPVEPRGEEPLAPSPTTTNTEAGAQS